jgi:hypothetical protein
MVEPIILKQKDLKPKYTIRQMPLSNLAIRTIIKTSAGG